ncbi:MAG TPA: hypothetical protein DEB06_01480 [Phycisphaerales bacterium]|nr:hypothetical protein [Phycisphaerales bacterium]
MSNAPTRLAYAVLALAVIWVFVYWRTDGPAPRGTVEFGEPPSVEEASPQDHGQAESVEVATLPEPVVEPAPAPIEPERAAPEGPPIASGVILPQFREHTVKRGETAETISQRYYGTPTRWDAVMRANPRVDFQRLRVGTVIRVAVDPGNIQGLPAPEPERPPAPSTPPPRAMEYRVKPGDTLSEIAKAVYGRSSLWTLIRDANIDEVGSDGSRLRAGTTIVIPPAPADSPVR